ncbi:hypothetical protein [Gordonia sp. CPCC 205333]|uniref:hypothetical protein n=1 Tax=Gordonia sp. CPCC 205333 TaxID=3140790 RepID=UPI003AF33B5E
MTNFPPGSAPAAPAFPGPTPAKQNSKLPLIALIIGGILLVVALVVAFIPFPHSADGGPTSAFKAQQNLDKALFGYAQSSGAKYSGSITYSFIDSTNSPEQTIEFKNLVVASNNNAEGTITMGGQEAQYRQLGNNVFLNTTKQFWTNLMKPVPEALDLDSVQSKWASADSAGLLWLGFLAPRRFAGRLAVGDQNQGLGQELDSPNKGLPDARFWPTSDPKVTQEGNNITVGTLTTTFAPDSHAVTHIKGNGIAQGTLKYKIDTSVSPVTDNDLNKMFANARSFAPELAAVPAPGLRPQTPLLKRVEGGSCAVPTCEFLYDVQGKLTSTRAITGYLNYGIHATFTANNRSVGGTCDKVVRVAVGTTARTQCDATNLGNLPGGTLIRPNISAKYLPFVTSTPADISRIIDNNEKSVKKKLTFERSGNKRPGSASKYNSQITDMPSSWIVKQGGYAFDGFGPSGSYLVTMSTGYDQHLKGGVFDPSWSGTQKLRDQAAQQVKAAEGTEIAWAFAEENSAAAARVLLLAAGITPQQITVLDIKSS